MTSQHTSPQVALSSFLSYETDSWDLSEAMKNGEPVEVVAARSQEAYETEHIPSSINIPHRTISVDIYQGTRQV